jgi:RHS repeat-associated protein
LCGPEYTDPEVPGTATEADRLGSYGAYYPWGEAKGTNNPADIWSFATYWRDSFTGLDYANQRYYSNVIGRFMTVDPANAGEIKNPQSLNRYSYVLNDPINGFDPDGLCTDIIGGITQTANTPGMITAQQFAQNIGAITALPFAGGGLIAGAANVLAQGMGDPTGATLTAFNAIVLAAQNPGPISIIAFSGGAQAFSAAWTYLNSATQSRITNITYIDPGSSGPLVSGYYGTNVQVLEDSTGFANTIMQLIGAMGTPTSPNPPSAQYVDTGTCGHDLSCIINNYYGRVAFGTTACGTGAGAVFGVPSGLPFVNSISFFGYILEPFMEPTPQVTDKITYNLPP